MQKLFLISWHRILIAFVAVALIATGVTYELHFSEMRKSVRVPTAFAASSSSSPSVEEGSYYDGIRPAKENSSLQDGVLECYNTVSYNVGYSFSPEADGRITELGLLATGTSQRTAYLYECTDSDCNDGTELVSISINANSGNWRFVALPTAENVLATKTYIVSVYNSSNNWCRRDATVPVIHRGSIGNGVNVIEGQFATGNNFPSGDNNTRIYGIADITFEEAIPSTDTDGTANTTKYSWCLRWDRHRQEPYCDYITPEDEPDLCTKDFMGPDRTGDKAKWFGVNGKDECFQTQVEILLEEWDLPDDFLESGSSSSAIEEEDNGESCCYKLYEEGHLIDSYTCGSHSTTIDTYKTECEAIDGQNWYDTANGCGADKDNNCHPAECGNGIVEEYDKEQCDDGADNISIVLANKASDEEYAALSAAYKL